ncbi:hypothetical protein AZE42_13663, partial [Rhizopogon vesiculosus]
MNFATLDEFSDNLTGMFEPEESTKQKRIILQGEALRVWQSDADMFLEEFLRLDGRGDYTQDGCVCGKEDAIYRCRDCHGCELLCCSCMIHIHERQPFHRMEYWDGTYFNMITLKSMGIRLQLGHVGSVQCGNPIPAFNDDFVII